MQEMKVSMEKELLEKIEKLQIVHIKKSDTLIFNTNLPDLPKKQVDIIREQLKDQLHKIFPENNILVLDKIDMYVIRDS